MLLNITNKIQITREANELILRVRMHPTLRSPCACNVFGVQLYKNNARALLSHILSIVNSDWLQHARSVHGVYEKCWYYTMKKILNINVTFRSYSFIKCRPTTNKVSSIAVEWYTLFRCTLGWMIGSKLCFLYFLFDNSDFAFFVFERT